MIEIAINNITKNFGYKNVLNGVNLEVLTGDRVAIVGRNGAGKTTIFKIMIGEETADRGTVSIRKGATLGYLEQIPKLFEEKIIVRDILLASLERQIQLKDKLTELEVKMSADISADKLDKVMREYSHVQNQFIALDGYDMENQLNRIINGFGLTEMLDKDFNVLSGGQKTIVKLAATVLKNPDILLLDEPTNHLDVKTLEWFEGFISKYQGTVVFISHDRYFLDKVTTKTIVLERGICSVFNGNYSFSIREQERLLLLEFENYKNQQKKIDAMKAAIKRYREWGDRSNNEDMYKKAKTLEKKLEKMDILERPQMEKPKIPIGFNGSRTGKDVLVLEDFCLSLGNQNLFVNAVLQVFSKEKACLMGDNGTGKTALIKVILGENTHYDGSLKINPSAKLGYIPQEIHFDNDKDTVIEAFRKEYKCLEGEARGVLARYFFTGDNVYKSVGALSGGEKVLLKLAVLMQNEVNFLILDEPTNHIDIETREILEDALMGYTGTLMFVSHDRYFINKIADKIAEINEKKLNIFYGTYDEYKVIN